MGTLGRLRSRCSEERKNGGGERRRDAKKERRRKRKQQGRKLSENVEDKESLLRKETGKAEEPEDHSQRAAERIKRRKE